MGKRVLRSFLYLDEVIVNDYLAQFEGGILEGPYTTKDTSSGSKEGRAGIKVWAADIGGNATSTNSSEVAQTISETPVSKFTRLYDLLKEDEMIQSLSGFDLPVYEEVQLSEIVEVRGGARLAQWEHLTRTISDFSSLIDIMEAVGQDPLTDPDVNQGFTTLIAKKVQEGTEIIITPVGAPEFKFVSTLDTTQIKRRKEELETEVTILGKVRRKLSRGETIDVFRLAPRLNPLEKLNRVQRRGASKSKAKTPSTDSPFDEVVKYPAMQLQPIAIYQ